MSAKRGTNGKGNILSLTDAAVEQALGEPVESLHGGALLRPVNKAQCIEIAGKIAMHTAKASYELSVKEQAAALDALRTELGAILYPIRHPWRHRWHRLRVWLTTRTLST